MATASNIPVSEINTLNRLKVVLTDLFKRSDMIKGFNMNYGDTEHIDVIQGVLTPYLYIEIVGQTIQDSRLYSQNQGYSAFVETEYNFNFYMLDKINKGEENFFEVMSDMNYLLLQLITNISNEQWFIDNEILITNDINPIPYFEETKDYQNGWVAQISLRVPVQFRTCNNPIIPPINQ